MSIIQVRNENIYYTEIGESEKKFLVFIHGATMRGEIFKQVAKMMPQFKCIMLDLPKHGQSEGNMRTTVEEFADFIEDFIDAYVDEKQVKDPNITLVGYSLGGAITIELGIRKYKYIDSLVIISSGADLETGAPLLTGVRSYTKETLDLDALFPICFGRNSIEEDKPKILRYFRNIAASIEVCYIDFIACTYYDKLDKVKDIDVPVLIISGDEDYVIPVECGINLRNNLANSVLNVFPYYGHSLLFEQEKEISNVINQFIHNTVYKK